MNAALRPASLSEFEKALADGRLAARCPGAAPHCWTKSGRHAPS